MTITESVRQFLQNNGTQIIATFAFIVSFLTLYYTQWKSFDPKIYSTGRYELSKNDGNIHQLAFSLALSFSNHGAKLGVIENIYAVFYQSDSRKVLLIPKYDVQSREINVLRDLMPMKATSFIAFSLGGKETITKKIMFVPWSSDTFEAPAGIYHIDIFVKTSNSSEWEKHETIRLKIEDMDIEVINRGLNVPPDGGVVNMLFQDKLTLDREEEFNKLNNSFTK